MYELGLIEKNMESKNIQELLSLNESDYSDFIELYEYLKSYIEKIKSSGFDNSNVYELRALIEKFIQFDRQLKTENESIRNELLLYSEKLELSCYKYSFNELSESDVTRHLIYQHLYSNFLKLFNKINADFRNKVEEFLDFDGLINYDISNKRKVIEMIQEAIELIELDTSLSEKSKKKIIKYLSDTVQELLNPKTNWKNFFVKTTEVIVVLGALGSLTGGVDAGKNLLAAKNAVESAKEVVVNTSINLNYMNVANTFNFNKPIEIENNRMLILEENNNKN
jgi:hypothetical protein